MRSPALAFSVEKSNYLARSGTRLAGSTATIGSLHVFCDKRSGRGDELLTVRNGGRAPIRVILGICESVVGSMECVQRDGLPHSGCLSGYLVRNHRVQVPVHDQARLTEP